MDSITEEDLSFHKTVGGVILKNNKILVLYHNKFNLWSIPIGKVKCDENYEDALKREIKEELGVFVKNAHCIDRKEIFYNMCNLTMTSPGYLYKINEYSGMIINKEPHKHKEIKFMEFDDLYLLTVDKKVTELTKLYIDYMMN